MVSVAKFGDFGLTLDPESLSRKVGVFREKTRVIRVTTRLSELQLMPSNSEALVRFAKIGGKLSPALCLSLHPVSTNTPVIVCLEDFGCARETGLVLSTPHHWQYWQSLNRKEVRRGLAARPSRIRWAGRPRQSMTQSIGSRRASSAVRDRWSWFRKRSICTARHVKEFRPMSILGPMATRPTSSGRWRGAPVTTSLAFDLVSTRNFWPGRHGARKRIISG